MFKEFLEEVVKKGFDPSLGLFKVRRVVWKKNCSVANKCGCVFPEIYVSVCHNCSKFDCVKK